MPKDGGDDLSRVSCSTRTIAVIMPNQDSIRTDPWETYLTTVDAVESLDGLRLLLQPAGGNPGMRRGGHERQQPAARHDRAQTVSCSAPDGRGTPTTSTLACTASDSGSGLANPADASFSLMTSVAAGTEKANAGTDSRVVCDVAGNCATAGPIAGNKIDRKAPSSLVTTPAAGAVYQLNQVVNAAYSCADGGSGQSHGLRGTARTAVPSTRPRAGSRPSRQRHGRRRQLVDASR